MDEASSKTKNSEMASGARYSVMMKYLYPDQVGKRYRDPVASGAVGGKAEPSVGGEEFFEKNFGQREGM